MRPPIVVMVWLSSVTLPWPFDEEQDFKNYWLTCVEVQESDLDQVWRSIWEPSLRNRKRRWNKSRQSSIYGNRNKQHISANVLMLPPLVKSASASVIKKRCLSEEQITRQRFWACGRRLYWLRITNALKIIHCFCGHHSITLISASIPLHGGP